MKTRFGDDSIFRGHLYDESWPYSTRHWNATRQYVWSLREDPLNEKNSAILPWLDGYKPDNERIWWYGKDGTVVIRDNKQFYILVLECFIRGRNCVREEIEDAFRDFERDVPTEEFYSTDELERNYKALLGAIDKLRERVSELNARNQLAEGNRLTSKVGEMKRNTWENMTQSQKAVFRSLVATAPRFNTGGRRIKLNHLASACQQAFPDGILQRKVDDKYVKKILAQSGLK